MYVHVSYKIIQNQYSQEIKIESNVFFSIERKRQDKKIYVAFLAPNTPNPTPPEALRHPVKRLVVCDKHN